MGKPASEKPRTISEAMAAYERKIEELELEKAMLEEENETLRSRVENFSSAGASTGTAVLSRGKGRDLYPGDIRDVSVRTADRAAVGPRSCATSSKATHFKTSHTVAHRSSRPSSKATPA